MSPHCVFWNYTFAEDALTAERTIWAVLANEVSVVVNC